MGEVNYLLSSVVQTIRILDLLAEEQMLGTAEISQKLKINKTSVFRYLYTLEAGGYVYKTSDAKYMLGQKFVYMGEIVAERQTEFSLARPELVRLRDLTGETVHLSILTPDLTLMFVDKVESRQTLQMRSRIGYQLPAYCSGSGKVHLAGLLGTQREKELKNLKLVKKTDRTITKYTDLISELEKVREQGYGEENGESETGLSCLAAPVQNLSGEVVLAVSISGPSAQLSENKDFYLEKLKETASSIAGLLGL